ncbi:hypothetical protein J6590_085903 [Homalodisca vitripennis]|nr:hypothetical protein J6590_085903 [Homalodisca vitripennis]
MNYTNTWSNVADNCRLPVWLNLAAGNCVLISTGLEPFLSSYRKLFKIKKKD